MTPTPTPDEGQHAMTDSELDAMERRCAAARQGPWYRRTINTGLKVVIRDAAGNNISPQTDGHFIANARADLPRCLVEIRRLQAEVERLRAELAPFQPMSNEEAEAALDAIGSPPSTPEEIERILKYATDPEYRAEHLSNEFAKMSRIARGLRAENERLRSALQQAHDLIAREHELGIADGYWPTVRPILNDIKAALELPPVAVYICGAAMSLSDQLRGGINRPLAWLSSVGCTDKELVVYLATREYPKDAVPATFCGWPVRVEYIRKVRPA